MKRSRSLPALAALLASGLLLAGCSGTGGGATGSSEGEGSGTVRFVAAEDPATFAPLIASFEKKYPKITVEYTQIPFDQYSSTMQQRLKAKDDTIDVFAVDQPNLAQIAAQGFLEDISDLSDKAKAATSAQQYGVNVYDGKLYGLPIWNSTQLMYFNKDALAKAGVTAPTADPSQRWTWEEVEKAGTQAQQAGIASGLLLEQVEAYYQLQPLAESLGGGSGITGDDGLSIDVTNAKWEKAMQWYSDTFSSGLSPRGVGGFQTSPQFSDGKVAFFVGGPWDVPTFEKSATFDWGVAPMPYFAGGKPVTPTGSWSWGVNTASKNKAAARTFLEYSGLDTAGNLATTQALTIIPANTAAEKQYLPELEKLGGTHATGVADLISHEVQETAVARPVSVGYVQFEGIMNKAFADIRNGSPVDDRLKQATSQVKDAWSQLK
ncbi:ABC transporter substrate-binding protein [Frigoribacterium sp. 2-23]|uniref:ABC transporter substrate-binding protein n=1 Tax=Frigoribacterium sp. 2-23 TaxID=3415006 RepID=UPI003C6FBCFC